MGRQNRPFSKLPDRTELARELRRLAQASVSSWIDWSPHEKLRIRVLWWPSGFWLARHAAEGHSSESAITAVISLPLPLTASSTHLAMDIRDKLAEKREAFFKEKNENA